MVASERRRLGFISKHENYDIDWIRAQIDEYLPKEEQSKMNREAFMEQVRLTNQRCEEILLSKGQEYSSDTDIFRNFEQAGILLNQSPHQALAGMMTKHIAAIYNFIASEADGKLPPLSQWQEKIQDTICYLHLLQALVKWYRK
jgi:hypothetical protein